MATVELWIQIENNPWDVAPHNIDRMTGQDMQQVTGNAPVIKTLISPVTGVVQSRNMFRPLSQDALILRRRPAFRHRPVPTPEPVQRIESWSPSTATFSSSSTRILSR